MENEKNISKSKILRNTIGQEAGCLLHPYRQSTGGSTGSYRFAFLKYPFGTQSVVSNRELTQRSKVEKGFFRSLQNLCEFYNLTMPDTEGMGYPENIAQAFASSKEQFDKIGSGLDLVILQTKNFATSIATLKSVNTEYDLYYFPICQIYYLWEKDKTSKLVSLALSLFAFLRQQLHVPFYTDPYTFMNNCYETVRNIIEEVQGNEYEDDLSNELLEEIDAIQFTGQEILSEINNASRLDTFEQEVKKFRPHNDKEKAVLDACKDALSLKEEYPDISLLTAIPNYLEDDPQDILCPDTYVSFHWGGESDWLENDLFEHINNYLSEFRKKQEPSSVQVFNRKVFRERHDLKMQEKLIAFFNKVAKALYEFHED